MQLDLDVGLALDACNPAVLMDSIIVYYCQSCISSAAKCDAFLPSFGND